VGAAPHPTLFGLASVVAVEHAIAGVRVESLLVAALALALAILLGTLWSSQVSRPVERLAAYSERLARGEWNEPLTLRSVRELQTLVAALDRMRGELSAYRDRLVVSERQAAWSQMARQMAHEFKNPLTPIAISIADLKRSYELERPDFPEILDQAARTIAEEVEALRRLVQEFSDFARLPAPRIERVRVSDVLAGLRTLYSREVAEGRLAFADIGPELRVDADPDQLRQALVNLIKNALEVSDTVRVRVGAVVVGVALEVSVADSGPGLDPEQRANLFVPGFSTKAHGSGLGLTIVERIVNDHGGVIAVDSGPAGGTKFRIRLPLERSAAARAPGEREGS
jgi:nitrogen fixation/metabolism regulation signal transduction histidine kinase